jgi:hypothetical protein
VIQWVKRNDAAIVNQSQQIQHWIAEPKADYTTLQHTQKHQIANGNGGTFVG